MSEAQTQTQTAPDTGTHERGKRRVLQGVIRSDKMDKTVVVEVTQRVKHRTYAKFVLRKTRYKAHDERNDARVGDKVRIIESRPRSKDKRWALQAILERGLG